MAVMHWQFMQIDKNDTQGQVRLTSIECDMGLSDHFRKSAEALLLSDNPFENQETLRRLLEKDPAILQGLSNHDLAGLLEKISGMKDPNIQVLHSIYKAYNPDEPQLSSLMQKKQDALFNALEHDPVIHHARANWSQIPDDEKKEIAKHLHGLHAQSYGFTPAKLEAFTRPPKGEIGQQTICFGFYDRPDNAICYNIYQPEPDHMVPTFRKGFSDFAATIFHEGQHAYQRDVVLKLEKDELEDNPVLKDFARIMRDSVEGPYYLVQPRVSFSDYCDNPSEKDAYKFQYEMEDFLKNGRREPAVSPQVSKPEFTLLSLH